MDFKNKYLKYKSKYLQLKSLIGGGDEIDIRECVHTDEEKFKQMYHIDDKPKKEIKLMIEFNIVEVKEFNGKQKDDSKNVNIREYDVGVLKYDKKNIEQISRLGLSKPDNFLHCFFVSESDKSDKLIKIYFIYKLCKEINVSEIKTEIPEMKDSNYLPNYKSYNINGKEFAITEFNLERKPNDSRPSKVIQYHLLNLGLKGDINLEIDKLVAKHPENKELKSISDELKNTDTTSRCYVARDNSNRDNSNIIQSLFIKKFI
jgi:hypothetical protein